MLEPGSDLPDDLRQAILGSRRRILFVEGEHKSLDWPIYGVLFEEVSVVPKGGCGEVIKAVNGLRGSLSETVDAIAVTTTGEFKAQF